MVTSVTYPRSASQGAITVNVSPRVRLVGTLRVTDPSRTLADADHEPIGLVVVAELAVMRHPLQPGARMVKVVVAAACRVSVARPCAGAENVATVSIVTTGATSRERRCRRAMGNSSREHEDPVWPSTAGAGGVSPEA